MGRVSTPVVMRLIRLHSTSLGPTSMKLVTPWAASSLIVSVQRTAGALGPVSVADVTQDGTGVNGINYTAVSNWLTWNNNDVSVKTVSIPTLEDNVVEGTKTFNVILTNAVVANNGSGAPTNNLVVIYPSNAVVSIADDDFYGQLNFARVPGRKIEKADIDHLPREAGNDRRIANIQRLKTSRKAVARVFPA